MKILKLIPLILKSKIGFILQIKLLLSACRSRQLFVFEDKTSGNLSLLLSHYPPPTIENRPVPRTLLLLLMASEG